MKEMDVYYVGEADMKGKLPLAALIAFSALFGSCSSFSYLQSENYVLAGIRMTTDRKAVSDMRVVNRWATVLGPTYSTHDVGVWAANRLAQEGRHDVLILVELISSCIPPSRGLMEENMWRISVYKIPTEDAAN